LPGDISLDPADPPVKKLTGGAGDATRRWAELEHWAWSPHSNSYMETLSHQHQCSQPFLAISDLSV